MKKTILIMALVLSAIAVTAQNVGGGRGQSSTEVLKGWNTFYLQYNYIGCSHDKGNWDHPLELIEYPKESANGLTLGLNHAFNIVPTLPIYVETGLGVQFAMYSDNESEGWEDDDMEKEKLTGHLLSAKVPVNILYHFDIPNTDLAVEPLFGFDFRVNILGEAKYKYSWKWMGQHEWRTDEEEVNLFKKEDMGGRAIKRFQAGWHVGANIVYKQIALGIQYGQDFTKFHDDSFNPKLKTTTISLGYRF